MYNVFQHHGKTRRYVYADMIILYTHMGGGGARVSIYFSLYGGIFATFFSCGAQWGHFCYIFPLMGAGLIFTMREYYCYFFLHVEGFSVHMGGGGGGGLGLSPPTKFFGALMTIHMINTRHFVIIF